MSIVKGARNLDSGEEVLRLGADAEGAGARGPGEAIPDSVERRHARVAAVAEDSPTSSSSTTTSRSTAQTRRAQAAARALGQGRRRHREVTLSNTSNERTPSMKSFWTFLALGLVPAVAHAQLNMYCSSPNTAWCQGMAVGFEKATGTKVAVVQKATGEMLAQIKAERANPKGDIWWAGAADNYLQAAEEGLLEEYRSPNVAPALRLGAAHHRDLEESRRRRLRRHPLARLQHRDRREEEAAGAEVLEGPHQSRAQGRGHARQSELVGHGVSHARVAGAGHGRGRGVPLHGGRSTRT